MIDAHCDGIAQIRVIDETHRGLRLGSRDDGFPLVAQ
jgi:hypothetical protein